jgi:hypothetical protein
LDVPPPKDFCCRLVAIVSGDGSAIDNLRARRYRHLNMFRRYISRDYGAAIATGPHGHLFGWPFHGIVVGTMIYPAPWTKLVFSFFRMFAVLAGGGMMFSARFRTELKTYPQEAYFAPFISSRYFATTI